MTQDDLIQEIEEDLQRQKAEKFWRAYGVYIVAAALAIVVSTGAIVAWKNYRTQMRAEATSQLISALDADKLDTDKKIEELEKFTKAHSGRDQAVFAKLNEAALLVKSGQKDKALEVYAQLSKDTKVEDVYRQLADLMIVQVEFDGGDVKKLSARLEPLMSPDCFWSFSAKEFAAHLALRDGDKAKAKRLFAELSKDAKVPRALAQRAADMLQIVNAD